MKILLYDHRDRTCTRMKIKSEFKNNNSKQQRENKQSEQNKNSIKQQHENNNEQTLLLQFVSQCFSRVRIDKTYHKNNRT